MTTTRIFRSFVIFFIIVIQLLCKEKPKEEYHILIPGVGYDNFKIDSTTLNDIVKTYGNGYKLDTFYRKTNRQSPYKVNDKGEIYSIGICYDSLGVRFFFYPGEIKIFSIILRPPFKGKTEKGIILNESTFKDIEKCYGESPWGFAPGRMSKACEGIWFTQKSNCTDNSSEKEIEACSLNKVTEITIAGFE